MFRLKRVVKSMSGRVFSSYFSHYSGGDKRLILVYHKVLPGCPDGLHDPAMYVTDSTLDMHIRELLRRFEIVSLSDLLRARKGRVRCAITFDDGWRDNYLYAFPVLKKHGIPATIFVPTNMIGPGKRYWFEDIWEIASRDRGLDVEFMACFGEFIPNATKRCVKSGEIRGVIDSLKKLPANGLDAVLTNSFRRLGLDPEHRNDTFNLSEMKEMGNNGIVFGTHGLNHRILPGLPSDIKRQEVFDSLAGLRALGVPSTDVFCYPNGDFDGETIHFVKQAGYEGGVTTTLGFNDRGADPFLLRRIGFHEEIGNSPALFWFRILQAMRSGSAR